ncbi:unnamed protein product [Rangifer tarandus platyrhynchus]|uniref:Uncharacterized protein n=1 Tax=Rangifer tarandus platyrhynchus TaxID=3082113 RepID=A0AC59YV36_RANTA
MVNTEIRLIIFFAAKDGESLYSQQKQDRELTVAQILNSLLLNSDLRSHTGSSTWDLGLSSEVLESWLFFKLLPEFRPLNSLIHCFHTLIVCMPSYVRSARVSIKCSGHTKEV